MCVKVSQWYFACLADAVFLLTGRIITSGCKFKRALVSIKHKEHNKQKLLLLISFFTVDLTETVHPFPGEERWNGLRWRTPQNTVDTYLT